MNSSAKISSNDHFKKILEDDQLVNDEETSQDNVVLEVERIQAGITALADHPQEDDNPSSSTFNALPTADPNIGYYISGIIGKGSFAIVRISEFRTGATRDVLACKIINLAKCPEEYIEHFLPREMSIWPEVKHRNLIGVHSIIESGSKIYVFAEYAPNGDLLDYIMQCGKLPEVQVNCWLRQIGEGVEYLHSHEIAHRDLKCENILITNNFNIRIADFGFVTRTFANNERIFSRTFCGSLAYAAPELIRGDPYDARAADIWSIGVVLYAMFNASMPFDDSDMKQLLLDQEAKHWRLAKAVRAALSRDAIQLLDGLLEPRVSKRLTAPLLLRHRWFTAAILRGFSEQTMNVLSKARQENENPRKYSSDSRVSDISVGKLSPRTSRNKDK